MKVFNQDTSPNMMGSSGSGNIKATYQQLVAILGEPTFDTPSGDNKVQKEWRVDFKGDTFAIYDWKTYDVEYTMNELDIFNIGSKASATRFIAALEEKIKELNT
jgi:hypothetical protein